MAPKHFMIPINDRTSENASHFHANAKLLRQDHHALSLNLYKIEDKYFTIIR